MWLGNRYIRKQYIGKNTDVAWKQLRKETIYTKKYRCGLKTNM